MAKITINLLESKNIIATYQDVTVSTTENYKIIAGEANATEFEISYPPEYDDYTFFVEMVNSRGYGIQQTKIENKVFLLPTGMAVAGYGILGITATKDDTTVAWMPVKIKVWNTLPEWKQDIGTNQYATIADVEALRNRVENITTTLVFETEQELDNYISTGSAAGKPDLNTILVGTTFYIKDTSVPDYWWDGTAKVELEAKHETLQAGTVTTIAAGEPARIEDSTGSPNHTFDFFIPRGEKGDKGEKGDNGTAGQNGQDGADGKDGVGITSITKTSTSGLVDTYTINLSNGSTSTFTVTNGKDGSTSSSNPNLLINSNFAINQRGQSSYTGKSNTTVYTADRWAISYSKLTFTPATRTLDVPENGSFLYYIDNSDIILGKTVTISTKFNNVVYSGSATLANSYSQTTYIIDITMAVGKFQLVWKNDKQMLVLQFAFTNQTGSFVIDFVKLELGDTATEYTPPDPATELARCQRYGVSASLSNLPFSGNGTDDVQISVPIPVTLRTNPTAKNVILPIYVGQGQYGVAFETLSAKSLLNNNMVSAGLTIHKPSGIPYVTFKEKELYLTVGGSCFFDAEIY